MKRHSSMSSHRCPWLNRRDSPSKPPIRQTWILIYPSPTPPVTLSESDISESLLRMQLCGLRQFFHSPRNPRGDLHLLKFSYTSRQELGHPQRYSIYPIAQDYGL